MWMPIEVDDIHAGKMTINLAHVLSVLPNGGRCFVALPIGDPLHLTESHNSFVARAQAMYYPEDAPQPDAAPPPPAMSEEEAADRLQNPWKYENEGA